MTKYSRSSGQQGRRGSREDSNVLFSFEYLDIRQGQTLKQWNANNDLIKLMELGHTLNELTISQAIAKKIIIQYDIEDKKKWNEHNMSKVSKWKYPNTLHRTNVPWSKIELGRKLRVIDYLELNVFYVVFIDNKHQFFPSLA